MIFVGRLDAAGSGAGHRPRASDRGGEGNQPSPVMNVLASSLTAANGIAGAAQFARGGRRDRALVICARCASASVSIPVGSAVLGAGSLVCIKGSMVRPERAVADAVENNIFITRGSADHRGPRRPCADSLPRCLIQHPRARSPCRDRVRRRPAAKICNLRDQKIAAGIY